MSLRLALLALLSACAILCGQSLLADETLLLSVSANLPTTAVAGDNLAVDIEVSIAADEPEPQWEVYEGVLDVWYADFVPNDELGGVMEQKLAMFSVEVSGGQASFTWIPKVAGGNRLHFRVPDISTAFTQSGVVYVIHGEPSYPVVAQFESFMQFMEYDQESELEQWITNGCTVAGSTTLFITWHDQFGNVCPIGGTEAFPDGSELELELSCEEPENDDWGLGFTVAFLEDDGYESIEEASQVEVSDKAYGLSDDDGDALRDALDGHLKGQTVPGQTFSLVTFQPRLYANTFVVRVVGWAANPPASSSIGFSLRLTMHGTIHGASVSGTGAIQAQLGTTSGSIGQPYLINESGLIMTAGFSVAWAMDARVQGNGRAYAGWFDVVQVAPTGTLTVGAAAPAPNGAGVVYAAGNLDNHDWAYVRIGYSAPGTGGIVWTGGKWLQ
jgi:hypothetical protein